MNKLMHKEDAIQLPAMLDEQETPFAHFLEELPGPKKSTRKRCQSFMLIMTLFHRMKESRKLEIRLNRSHIGEHRLFWLQKQSSSMPSMLQFSSIINRHLSLKFC